MYAHLHEPPTWRKRLLSASTALGCVLVAGSAAITQFVAYRVGYHPALGQPLFTYDQTPFYAPWLWIEWINAPWAPLAKRTFDLVRFGLLASGVASMLMAFRWAAMQARKMKGTKNLHGSAQWAKRKEVERAGILDAPEGESIYIGEWQDERGERHVIRDNTSGHVGVIAPTRSGKGVSFVVPTLYTWLQSIVVSDEKGELLALARPWLESNGHTVLRYQPGSSTECDATYNFLDSIKIGTDYEVSDAQNIALMLVDTEGKGLDDKDPHWRKTAYSLLSGLLLFVKLRDPRASLGDVADAFADPSASPDKLCEEMLKCNNLFVAQTGQIALSKDDRERRNVYSTVGTALELFRDPVIKRNSAVSTFSVLDIVDAKNPAALFIVTPGLDLLRLRPLKRLLIAAIFRTLMSKPLEFVNGQPKAPYKHKLLVLLDEFPSDGRQDIIEAAAPKCAGYGIRLMMIMQDREQLLEKYGRNESILANCRVRVALALNSPDTADWFSRLAGDTTVLHETVSESGKRFSSAKNVSRSIKEIRRRLITPDEIMRLSMTHEDEPGEALVCVQGTSPMIVTQTPYYLNETFRNRAKVAP